MSPGRLNLLVFVAIILLISVNGAAFTYRLWGPALNQYATDFWKAHTLQPAVKAGDRTISECLGVSDFYSVHLTTYFLPDSDESAGGATDDLSKYDEYCDRVPGTGKVIFSVTLMEKEARNESVALSFYQVQSDGGLKEINAIPAGPRTSGFVTLDASVAHKGKYLLKLAFGEAKNAEDTIEMPIFVGQ
ncbi:MAG: hypothetical protein FJX16_09350 [Alphaproteobacteria bacterium]|nr:hypothetical protein [Alphaproteobacteria bacterium]MBM3625506.1 hypothetical protein [Alphaproteobacteria bacterium]